MSEINKFPVGAEEEFIPQRPDYTEELIALIRGDLPRDALREALEDYHDSDLADVLAEITIEERRRLYLKNIYKSFIHCA